MRLVICDAATKARARKHGMPYELSTPPPPSPNSKDTPANVRKQNPPTNTSTLIKLEVSHPRNHGQQAPNTFSASPNLLHQSSLNLKDTADRMGKHLTCRNLYCSEERRPKQARRSCKARPRSCGPRSAHTPKFSQGRTNSILYPYFVVS